MHESIKQTPAEVIEDMAWMRENRHEIDRLQRDVEANKDYLRRAEEALWAFMRKSPGAKK